MSEPGDNIAVVPQKQPPHSNRNTPPSQSHPSAQLQSGSDFAQRHAGDWTAPSPFIPENGILTYIKAEWKSHPVACAEYEGYKAERPILIADISRFEVYISPLAGPEGRKFELTALHLMQVPTPKSLCVDGFIRVGQIKQYIHGAAIEDISIEGYGDGGSLEVVAYIKTELASKDLDYDIWYRLRKPTRGYKRYHRCFLQVAQLGKHVLDFLDEQPAASVNLDTFKADFHDWLTKRYCQTPKFQKWHNAFRHRVDFRCDIHAYKNYLYDQAYNLPSRSHLLAHSVWADCMTRGLTTIKKHDSKVKYTLATPAVYKLFKDMYFGKKLQPVPYSQRIKSQRDCRISRLGFARTQTEPPMMKSTLPKPRCRSYEGSLIKVGDVVAFEPDVDDQKIWRNANEPWLAYVQRVEVLKGGVQRLFVIYLYRPSDTNIFRAEYPHKNELFFSDNCNCGERELLSTDLSCIYDIDWTPSSIPCRKPFVRQTYMTQQSAFRTFKHGHTTCACRSAKGSLASQYTPGDTVYVKKRLQGEDTLEPVLIHEVHESTDQLTIRRLGWLLRGHADLAKEAERTHVAANELVLTDHYEKVQAVRIERKCNIIFVHKSELLQKNIPFPYDREGTGDFFVISMGVENSDGISRLRFLKQLPSPFKEGPLKLDLPEEDKLIGLSLFSGGGNLDRGLEEGGAAKIRYAVDLSPEAVHTQRANSKEPRKLKICCISVDDYFKLVASGEEHELLAQVGEIAIIVAGTPCPGFSSLQQNFQSEASLKNASYITTFCSYVELFLPKYGILENVPNMASTRTGFEDQNILSQLVACLVSIGYQVNQCLADVWSYGSPQQRSRIILTIAAPGLEPIELTRKTHNMPFGEASAKSLGLLPNGERFGGREHQPTPFPYVPISDATRDLPSIGNGNIQTCISYPDHRLAAPQNRRERALLELIPTTPAGCGYQEAWKLGIIPPSLQKVGKERGNAYRRVSKQGLIPTITANQNIQDARNGAAVHWEEPRPITIMEARRAQGYLDDEVVIGNLSQQYRIIGNGVDRKLSFALGLAIRQAVLFNTNNRMEPRYEVLVDAEGDEDKFAVHAPRMNPSLQNFKGLSEVNQDDEYTYVDISESEDSPDATSAVKASTALSLLKKPARSTLSTPLVPTKHQIDGQGDKSDSDRIVVQQQMPKAKRTKLELR